MSDRVAVVTGANRGIGQAVALALARSGFLVAVTARRVDTLSDTVERVRSVGGSAVPLACDIREESSVRRLAQATAELGQVHTVVANAGTPGPAAPLHAITPEQWRDCLATNLDGVYLTFRALLPPMLERKDGCLIAMSSMTGKHPLPGRTPYAAAKMGLIGLVRTLAAELGPYGIRVNSVCPGAVGGGRFDEVVRRHAVVNGLTDDEARAGFASASPMGKLVQAGEVAAACAFLASAGAAAITGEDLNVTAGAVMH